MFCQMRFSFPMKVESLRSGPMGLSVLGDGRSNWEECRCV
jgi:hypothetical protein